MASHDPYMVATNIGTSSEEEPDPAALQQMMVQAMGHSAKDILLNIHVC